MTYLRLAGIVLCLGLAAAAPTTAPATRPVLDQTSPTALLRSFFSSRGEVDEATIRSLLHATNPAEQKILDAVIEVELAHGRLRAAQKAKLGKATTTPSVTRGGLEPDTPEELASLEEKIEGDRATVSSPMVPGMSMQFVRVDGRWKLPIASLVGPIDASDPRTMDAARRAQVEIIDALTADVMAGKWTTEDAVHDELTRRFAERLAAAVKPSQSDSPAPTTTPVSKPARGT